MTAPTAACTAGTCPCQQTADRIRALHTDIAAAVNSLQWQLQKGSQDLQAIQDRDCYSRQSEQPGSPDLQQQPTAEAVWEAGRDLLAAIQDHDAARDSYRAARDRLILARAWLSEAYRDRIRDLTGQLQGQPAEASSLISEGQGS